MKPGEEKVIDESTGVTIVRPNYRIHIEGSQKSRGGIRALESQNNGTSDGSQEDSSSVETEGRSLVEIAAARGRVRAWRRTSGGL